MGLFDKKQSLSRQELREVFEKDSGVIPKTGGKKYYQEERKRIERDVFGAKYGSQISKSDYRDALHKLKSQAFKARDRVEKEEIEKKIEYLKRVSGEK
ncbi:MAG: hypothetical protein PHI53_02065 [Candidatus Pacebacteria bacterium]|nr:hypothetical protein [Candidatus Paceibacterota bacterium]